MLLLLDHVGTLVQVALPVSRFQRSQNKPLLDLRRAETLVVDAGRRPAEEIWCDGWILEHEAGQPDLEYGKFEQVRQMKQVREFRTCGGSEKYLVKMACKPLS